MFRWPDRRYYFAAMTATAVLACAGTLLAQQVFRADVNLVHSLVTVKTRGGELVGTLEKDDFEVYDNGVKQQISVFEHQTEQPLSVALAIDTSGSTAKDLKYEADASSRFFRALLGEGNLNDVVSLFTFNYEVRQRTRFIRDLRELDAQLKLLHGEAGTALYDAIYLSSRELEQRSGRKAIVLVTDGGNTFSKYTIHEALEAAHLADAVVYAAVVVPIANEAGRNTGGEHSLQFLAEGTGGKIFFPLPGPELDKVFDQIIRDLRTQYLIAFYPKGAALNKNRFHQLEIKVKRPDLRVSARNGYYGEVEGGYAGSREDRINVSPERQQKPPQQVKKKP
jgi:Ca-activated chloride channel family protein